MHKTIEDGLRDGECRWIVSDGPATFCCEPARPLSSYCPTHHKVVYVSSVRPRPRTATMLPVDFVVASDEPEAPAEPRIDLVEMFERA